MILSLSILMKGKEDGSKADKMADYLAEKLYYHSYLISRAEAPKLGLKVINPDSDLENLMWDLFVAYKQEMNLGEPFDPMKLIPPDKAENTVVQSLAFVESTRQRFICSKELRIFKIPQPPPNPPGIGIQERVLGWQEVLKENK